MTWQRDPRVYLTVFLAPGHYVKKGKEKGEKTSSPLIIEKIWNQTQTGRHKIPNWLFIFCRHTVIDLYGLTGF